MQPSDISGRQTNKIQKAGGSRCPGGTDWQGRKRNCLNLRDAEVLAQACLLWLRARRGHSLGLAGRNLNLGQGRAERLELAGLCQLSNRAAHRAKPRGISLFGVREVYIKASFQKLKKKKYIKSRNFLMLFYSKYLELLLFLGWYLKIINRKTH